MSDGCLAFVFVFVVSGIVLAIPAYFVLKGKSSCQVQFADGQTATAKGCFASHGSLFCYEGKHFSLCAVRSWECKR